MKRMLMVVAVAALMAVMLSVSAAIAFADPNEFKDLCKQGGFSNFIDPVTGVLFASQGDCIDFVNNLPVDSPDDFILPL